MAKVFYLHLAFIIHTCMYDFFNGFPDSFQENDDYLNNPYIAENFQLEYSRGSVDPIYFSETLKGQKIIEYITSHCVKNMKRNVNVYKLSLENKFLTASKYNDDLVLSIKEVTKNVKRDVYTSRRYGNAWEGRFDGFVDSLFCNLYYCEIGSLDNCDWGAGDADSSGILSKAINRLTHYYYIGFIKSEMYPNLILKFIPKNNNNKYVFNVVFCPSKKWVIERRDVGYFLDDSNLVDTIKMNQLNEELFLKLAYCHNNKGTFINCGRLDQKYMPSINVGYECNDYNKEESNRIHNKDEKKTDMLVISNDVLMCSGHSIFKSSSRIVSVLPPENNYIKAGTFKVSIVNQTTNLYPEQKLQLIDVNDITETYPKAGTYLGFVVNYEPKCNVPYLNVKLFLKISDSIQKFENKADDIFGKIDTYIVDRRKMNNAHVGCHVVFEGKKHPAFNDFYENFCQPSLLMLDGKTGKFIEITDIQSFQPNNKYICALRVKNANSKNGKQRYIHKTEFTITLIDSNFTVWIIFGIFIIIAVLLIVGLLILKKFKRKKSNNNSSTSSSQSTTKSSTVVSTISNVPIIKKKEC
uniref:6-cysteine protein n=1 Tax=Strongyloides papillosus TaxID=174720 RepID=A0A0N5B6V0_STREA